MVNGSRRWSALIIFLKKRFAAETSRFAESMNSIVFPSLSTARYRYFHCLPTFTNAPVHAVGGARQLQVRPDAFIDFRGVSLDPTKDRGVVHVEAALTVELFD